MDFLAGLILICVLFCKTITIEGQQKEEVPACIEHKTNSKDRAYCTNNDTYCGEWTDKKWNPIGCKYRDISGADARKCLANRTIGCIGDSQARYLCNGLVYLLYDMPLDAPFVDPGNGINDFFDFISNDSTKIVNTNVNEWYRIAAPTKFIQEFNDFTWQVQHWNIVNFNLTNLHIHEVLQNKYLNEPSSANLTKLKRIDFAIWNFGIHEHSHFNTTPMGEKNYNLFVKKWIDLRKTAKFPVVWMSLNTQCGEKYMRFKEMADEANYYVHKRLKEEGLPYFDSTSVMRTNEVQKCLASRDGLHVHHWVDVVRANILLNHLCDEDNNWVGGDESFL